MKRGSEKTLKKKKKLFRKLKKIFIWLRKETFVKLKVFKFMKDFYKGLETDLFSALME